MDERGRLLEETYLSWVELLCEREIEHVVDFNTH
jgi:hypothetical protein